MLDARIVPPLDGLVIEKFATSTTDSVLAIYVPKQPAEMQPCLVHDVIVEGKVEGAFFRIVRRRGEGSITTSAQQITPTSLPGSGSFADRTERIASVAGRFRFSLRRGCDQTLARRMHRTAQSSSSRPR